MMTLYDYLPSQNAWKVRLLLSHLQQPYAQKLISIFEGQGQQQDYLSINPTGAVPAIELQDGSTIAESNAILIYLAEGTPYLPTHQAERARVMQWLFFEADYVQSSVATLRHWVLTGKDRSRSKELVDSKRVASRKVLSQLESALDESLFLTPAGYSIADISVFAYVHLAEEAGLSLASFGNVRRWIDSVSDQAGVLPEVYPYSIDEHSGHEL